MRRIDFFDGAQSSTVPTIGNITADNLSTYADDASYEASVQGAPAEGNIYYNTTLDKIRYYSDGAWRTVVDETTAQTLENKTIDGTAASGNNTITADANNITHDPSGNSFTSTDMQALSTETAGRLDTNETNISANQTNIDDLETLSGSAGATNHGTFTGSTIPDSSTTKGALQSLETEVESKIDTSEKGAANGVASLDGSGVIPAGQLPSYVDDVLEFADLASFPATGESGKIYIALDTNFQYRWTGSIYVDITSKVDSVNGNTGVVVLDSDDISEGSTNEYYTEAKVTANVSVTANTAKVSADGSIDTHSDVDTSSTAPTDGQVLTWVAANSAWEPQDSAGGSVWTMTGESSNFTAIVGTFYKVNVTSGNVTATLPAASGNNGAEIGFIITNSGNELTIDGNGAETIDGDTDFRLRGLYEYVVMICDGTSWFKKNVHFTEVLSSTSNVVAAGGTAGEIYSLTGNGLTLNPGVFEVRVAGHQRRTGTGLQRGISLTMSESSNSLTTIGTGGNLSVEVGPINGSFFNEMNWNSNNDWDNLTVYAEDIITCTSQDDLFGVISVVGNTTTNYEGRVHIYARRVG